MGGVVGVVGSPRGVWVFGIGQGRVGGREDCITKYFLVKGEGGRLSPTNSVDWLKEEKLSVTQYVSVPGSKKI